MNKSITHSKGQSLAEFALTVPLMLLLIFTFLDFGRAIYYYSAISNAVREGARFAIVTNNEDRSHDDEIKSIVIDFSIAVNILPENIDIDYSGTDNEFVEITVTFEFSPVTPFLAQLLGGGNTITLSSDTRMMLSPLAH
jgi:Flp pilus assembly protein TadG